jgi:hypothetical protein
VRERERERLRCESESDIAQYGNLNYLSVDFNEEPGCFLTRWSAWYTGIQNKERKGRGREREERSVRGRKRMRFRQVREERERRAAL